MIDLWKSKGKIAVVELEAMLRGNFGLLFNCVAQ